MHFRFRNNLVQVIRTTYDPATKKPRTEIVGRLRRGETVPGAELIAACTSAEADEVRRWVASHMKADAVAAEHAARSLAEQMAKATEWFTSTKDEDSARLLAADLLQQWVKLRKQLHRDGLLD